jgi:uncharacterized cupredoxin-like copper-binding protein
MNKDVFTATGQGVLNPYGVSSSRLVDPTKPIYTAEFSSAGLAVNQFSYLQKMHSGNYDIYVADGSALVHNLVNNVWHYEWTVKNSLTVPITVEPHAQLEVRDAFRMGEAQFAGAPQGCPARGPSVNTGTWLTWLTPALPSVADGTHDGTLVTMSFQVSTLNIAGTSTSSTATNNEPIVSTSVRNDFLKLHPEAAKISPAANQIELRKSLCSVDTQIGTVYGKKTTLQPGQSATITSTTNSKDWGFACSPVDHALINYNVQAGSSTYQALKTSELIVFSPEESNICGS